MIGQKVDFQLGNVAEIPQMLKIDVLTNHIRIPPTIRK